MDSIATSHGITFARDLARLGAEDREFRRAAARGELVRVHRGAYMSATDWNGLDRYEQYRRRVLAVALSGRNRPVLTHESAAAVWGIPTIGKRGSVIHVLTTPSAGSRAENGVQRHGMEVEEDDILEDGGVRFTSFRRTVRDLMRDSPFPSAVAAVDWALRPPDNAPKPWIPGDVLAAYVGQTRAVRRQRQVDRVLEFADPRSESPGESLSRVVIEQLGFPRPELQIEISDTAGFAGRVDFYWPDERLIGEFDGDVKYGRDAAVTREALLDEKRREDRLRATARHMARWDWKTVLRGPQFFDVLLRAGLTSRVARPSAGHFGQYGPPNRPRMSE